jgi:hypothetical protein
MSVTTDIFSGSPSVPDAIEGDGWHAALCLAWAQITDGAGMCEHCGEPAVAVVATGADPEYVPLCWEAAAPFILVSLDMGARMFGAQEPEAG